MFEFEVGEVGLGRALLTKYIYILIVVANPFKTNLLTPTFPTLKKSKNILTSKLMAQKLRFFAAPFLELPTTSVDQEEGAPMNPLPKPCIIRPSS